MAARKSDTSNGWHEHQLLVLSKLDELKKSQQKTNEFLYKHVESNQKDFEAIRLTMAKAEAAHEAVANTKAKFWGFVGGAASLIGGAIANYFIRRGH